MTGPGRPRERVPESHDAHIVERWKAGERVVDIAATYGCTGENIAYHVARVLGDDMPAAREERDALLFERRMAGRPPQPERVCGVCGVCGGPRPSTRKAVCSDDHLRVLETLRHQADPVVRENHRVVNARARLRAGSNIRQADYRHAVAVLNGTASRYESPRSGAGSKVAATIRRGVAEGWPIVGRIDPEVVRRACEVDA